MDGGSSALRMPLNRRAVALAAIGLGVAAALVGAPLLGWPRVVRLPAVIVPAMAIALAVVPPSRWRESGVLDPEWRPSARVVWSTALLVFLGLFWYVLTRFRSGEINAIDFTIYFDRPCFQTVQGRPLFVETSDTPGLSQRSELGDHAYWAMLLVCSPYALHPTPLWLHALSALAVAAGAFHTFRILQAVGAGGLVASATAMAFVLNDNTARALNYGFHPELLYAWFVPWLLDTGLRGARRSFLAATLACVLVKEDACLPLFAATVALAMQRGRSMTWRDRGLFLVLPNALALANLALFYGYMLPLLRGESRAAYAHFWRTYGDTPIAVLLGMAAQPWRVLKSVATSGVFRTIQPHLFLPLVGWRWAIGTLPTIVLFGASANDQVRAFGIYYAVVLVPFFVIAASVGALTLARRFLPHAAYAAPAAAAVILLGPLLVGSGHRGYSLRPWKEETAAVPRALAALADEPRVLVQSGLFPHAGYDERLQLLTPETLADPRNEGAVLLLASRVSAYPFRARELIRLARPETVRPLSGGLVAARVSHPAVKRLHRVRPRKSRSGACEGCGPPPFPMRHRRSDRRGG